MLTSTSKFLNQLRRDKIPAPSVRDFNETRWRQDYATLAADTPEERAIFEAGLWVAPQLKSLWATIDTLDITRFDFDSLVTMLMLLSVREFHLSKDSLPINRPASMSADYNNTALGDALWRALTFLASKRAEFRGELAPDAKVAAALLQLCSTIYVLEFMMGRVIHCGWQLTHSPEGPMFCPLRDSALLADNECIALATRSEEHVEFYLINRHAWDGGGLRSEAPFQLRLASRTPTRAKFRIVKHPPKDMPSTIALFEMDIPPWMRSLLETELEGHSGLSVGQLVSGWLLLHTVFELIFARDTRDGFADFATGSLHEDDLLEAFRMHGYPRDLAKVVIAFFTYDWRRHEALWAAPLVKVRDLYYPFLPSLIEPNLTRMLDLWLQRCEYTTKKGNVDTLLRLRGALFEQHVRSALHEYFEQNPSWEACVEPRAVVISGAEIDLLWRAGSTVFVGDAKFMKFPANPNEIGHYYRELEHGAQQVSDRVKLLAADPTKVAQLLRWGGEPSGLTFQPLVVCGHAMGSGLSLSSVPCIQADMLEMFFRQSHFVMSGSLEGSRDIALPLPKGPDLAAIIRFYLAHPPGIWFRQFAVETVQVVCCKIGEMEVHFEHRAVNLPHTIEREPYCRERLAQWETMLAAI